MSRGADDLGCSMTRDVGQDVPAEATSETGPPAVPLGVDRPLCEAYDVALLDLDGVVYIGHRAVPGAADALGRARAAGMRTAFVTNNAFRTPAAVAALLTELGVAAAVDDVVTSAQAAARLLARRLAPGAPVLVVGGMGLRVAVREMGLRPVSTAAERPAAVVQGYNPGLSYGLIAEGGAAVAAGALFVASNADTTVPGNDGRLRPGNGSLIEVITKATGRDPIVAGKPERPLHREAILRTGARRPLVVGDRLDTDIAGARRAGADSLFVLTGVTDVAGLLAAPAGSRPDYIADDLSGLLVRHPAVHAVDPEGGKAAGFRCGGWTARLAPCGGAGDDGGPGRLELSGGGERLDAVRALCAVAWRAERPVDVTDLPEPAR
jgi:glycerol 3-phosphatase-2